MTKKSKKASIADMSPEEKDAYIASLEESNAVLGGKLKAAKIDDVDTSFEADGKKYDFTTKLIHIFGETIDVRTLIDEDSDESMEKFDKICAELVKLKSGIIKPI